MVVGAEEAEKARSRGAKTDLRNGDREETVRPRDGLSREGTTRQAAVMADGGKRNYGAAR